MKNDTLENKNNPKASNEERKLTSFISSQIGRKSYEQWNIEKNRQKSSDAIDIITRSDEEYTNSLTEELSDLEKELDQMASGVITKIISDNYRSFASIDKFNKFNVFRYFYKTNPVLGRCIDLHVDLPLSKLKLTPPKNIDSELVKDYIYYFYDSLFSKIDIFNFLREFVKEYRIYGEAFALVEDNYASLSKSFDLASLENLSNVFSDVSITLSDEDSDFVKRIDADYKIDPKKVSVADRMKYLGIVFPYFNKEYKGVDRISTVPFYKIDEYQKNHSSDYRAIKIKIDPKLKSNIDSLDDLAIKELRITKSFVNLIKEAISEGDGKIEVDNNPYKDRGNSSYIFDLGFDKQMSLVNRVIDQSFEWEVLKSAVRTKINLVGKVGRIIVAPNIGEEELKAIKSELEYMSQNPDSEFVANYDVDIKELGSNVKEDLSELIGNYERLKEETALGLGTPLNLISGESQYSGDVIKLEIMNNEFLNFKSLISKLFEEVILKPIAVRKGFFKINEWGDIGLVYPTLTFSRASLRSESQYDLLYNLYSQNVIPASIIYDLVNIDSDAVEKALKKEMFSIKNPHFGELLSSIYSNVASEVGQDKEVNKRVREELGLKIPTTSGEVYEEFEEDEGEGLPDLNQFRSSIGMKPIKRVENPQKKFERPDIKKNIDPQTSKKVKEENKLKKLKI